MKAIEAGIYLILSKLLRTFESSGSRGRRDLILGPVASNITPTGVAMDQEEVFVTATYKFVVPEELRGDAAKTHIWMNNVCEGIKGLQVWVDGGEQQEYPMQVVGRVAKVDNAKLETAAAIFGSEYVRTTPEGGIEFLSIGEDNGKGRWRPYMY